MSRKVFNNIARAAGYAKTRRLLWGSAAAIGALAVSPAWGTAVCTPASGTYDATIAVAANFYVPAQNLVADFTAPGQPYAGYVIRVCEDSTGALNTAIRSGNANGYSLFLAANATTPIGLQGTAYVQTGATYQPYATGIPVLAALYATVPNISTLMASQSGVKATINYNNLMSVPLDTTHAGTVAVADPTPAPYGDAAFKIMSSTPKGMNLFAYSTPGTEPNPLPSYLSSKYANIDLTWASVLNGTNKSGFVSKAQICAGIYPAIPTGNPTYTYVEFTGSNYKLLQAGILIKSGLTGQDQIGSDLLDFMLNNSDPNYWPTFLTNHCYFQI